MQILLAEIKKKAASSEYKEVLPFEPISSVCIGSSLLKCRVSSVGIQAKLCVEEQVIVLRFPARQNILYVPGPNQLPIHLISWRCGGRGCGLFS
jgi:hypothetical protein